MKSRHRTITTAFVLALLVILSAEMPARTLANEGIWYMTPGARAGNDCASPATACSTVTEVLNKPNFAPGDTVKMTVGTFRSRTWSSVNAVLDVGKSVNLSGGWDATFTTQIGLSTLDGQAWHPGILISSDAYSAVTVNADHLEIVNGGHVYTGGGGIENWKTLNASWLYIHDNHGNDAGGIHNYGTLVLSNSSVTRNNGDYGGGGLYNERYGYAAIINSTFAENNLFEIGNDGQLDIASSTIVGGGNGGIENRLGSKGLTLKNTVVAGHSTDCHDLHPGTMTSLGYNLIQTNGNCNLAATDLVGRDPQVGPLAGSPPYVRLLAGSPAADAGDPAGCTDSSGRLLTTDQRGFPRVERCDIGAFELQRLDYTRIAVNKAAALPGDSLTYTISLENPSSTDVADINVTDILPSALTYVESSLTASGGTAAYEAGTVTWTGILPAHSTIDINFSATIDPNLQSGQTLSNAAVLSYEDQRIARTAVTAVPSIVTALAASSVTADKTLFSGGEPLTVTITVDNANQALDLTDVAVTATISDPLNYAVNSLTATIGTATYADGKINWAGTVPHAGRVAIVFEGVQTASAPAGNPVITAVDIARHGERISRSLMISVPGQTCSLNKSTSNPVLTPNGVSGLDDQGVYEPSVIKDDGTYKMWYGAKSNGVSRIAYATSSDGYNWVKQGIVLGPGTATWEASGVSSPSVIKDGALYRMWYTGRENSTTKRIGYAYSTDGINWTRNGNFVLAGTGELWDSTYTAAPSVLKVGKIYHMWYSGSDQTASRIGHAVSNDGLVWQADAANPILNMGPAGGWDWLHVYGPSVVYFGGEYQLWYSGTSLPSTPRTGLATSSDLQNWSRAGQFLSEGGSGSYDRYGADNPTALDDGGQLKIYYSAQGAGGIYQIALAVVDYAHPGECPIPEAPPQVNAQLFPLLLKNHQSDDCQASFSESFENPGSGWPIFESNTVKVGYKAGRYQIRNKLPFYGEAIAPGVKDADYVVAVTAKAVWGNPGSYGIMFGINGDWSEFYQFLISSNFYSLWRYSNGQWAIVQNWTSKSFIHAKTLDNRLKLVRNGPTISLYINDQLARTLRDDSFLGTRRIGLIVNSASGTGFDVRFDDFALYSVSCGANGKAPVKMLQAETHTLPLPLEPERQLAAPNLAGDETQETVLEPTAVDPVGPVTSLIVASNPSTTTANAVLHIYNGSGREVYQTNQSISAHGLITLTLPADLPYTFQGSGIMTSTVPLQTAVLNSNQSNTARDISSGATVSGPSLFFPVLAHNTAPRRQTVLAIQNPDAVIPASIQVHYYDQDGQEAIGSPLTRSIPPLASTVVDSRALFGALPFTGQIHIESSTPVVATQQLILGRDSAALPALAESDAAPAMTLGWIERTKNSTGVLANWAEIYIANRGSSSAKVKIDFYTTLGILKTTQSGTIPINGVWGLSTATVSALGSAFKGYARVTQEGNAPLLASWLEFNNVGAQLYAYPAVPVGSRVTTWVCSNFTRIGLASQVTTIRVVNLDSEDAEFNIQFFDRQSGVPKVTKSYSLGAGKVQVIPTSGILALGASYTGMGIIQSTNGKNILVTASNSYRTGGATSSTCSPRPSN